MIVLVTGNCVGCGRLRPIAVSAPALARLGKGTAVTGTCGSCCRFHAELCRILDEYGGPTP